MHPEARYISRHTKVNLQRMIDNDIPNSRKFTDFVSLLAKSYGEQRAVTTPKGIIERVYYEYRLEDFDKGNTIEVSYLDYEARFGRKDWAQIAVTHDGLKEKIISLKKGTSPYIIVETSSKLTPKQRQAQEYTNFFKGCPFIVTPYEVRSPYHKRREFQPSVAQVCKYVFQVTDKNIPNFY